MLKKRDIEFRHLRVLKLLLEVQNLTAVADILGTSQPVVSKMLARLRSHFGDPLLVRVGMAMHPTPRALEIVEPLRALLSVSDSLQARQPDFDPTKSDREFKVLVSAVGMIRLVPPIMQDLEQAGPDLRVRALPFDGLVSRKLESGEADIALGVFPEAISGMRRQRLYTDDYVSVVRANHPRLRRLTKQSAFLAERHIVVMASSAGHAAHQQLERALTAALHPNQIKLRVPSFVTCAFVASRTDAVGCIPLRLAEYIAQDLKLAVFAAPLSLPRLDISQLWHERVTRDAGHRWLRSRIMAVLGGRSG